MSIKLNEEYRQTLKDLAELAYEMGDIQKPDLTDLIQLFIAWGLSIQKKKWLDRKGIKG